MEHKFINFSFNKKNSLVPTSRGNPKLTTILNLNPIYTLKKYLMHILMVFMCVL